MKRRGRPRKQAVARSVSGRIVKSERTPVETQEQVLATCIAQPHRKGASDPRSPLLGHSLGRLHYDRDIDADQFESGRYFAGLWRRYHSLVTGIRLPRVTAHFAEMVASGGEAPSSHDPRDEEERVAAVRDDWAVLQDMLATAAMLYEGNRLLTKVCVMDRELASGDDLRDFKKALNIVGRARGLR